ncbi:MAG: DUF1501 domain-containing protein [Saprospiraceae bacterium]|nr:DUF1501 domain-containing protein [Saprospiraceae bacterium]
MNECGQYSSQYSRRDFLSETSLGLGSAALASLMTPGLLSAKPQNSIPLYGLQLPPKAKRVIYLFQSGAPSQMELFDYKPALQKMNGKELPESIRKGQRLTGMTVGQKSFPIAAPQFTFSQYGDSGAWMSELIPHMASIVNDLCIVKSMHTEAINHDPAITFFQTGSQQPGRPCIGSWISYGLGSDNDNLPTFCVLLSEGRARPQPLYSRLWGNGFLPSKHQGVQFRSGADPVLYLNNPASVTKEDRARQLAYLEQLHRMELERMGDPEINTNIAKYEMAFRMQTSIPETMDISKEPEYINDMYGPDSKIPGTYAANCLLARRLAERNVKFIQLYHQGWDHHGSLPKQIRTLSKGVDQPSAALIKDLKQRGLLDDTLVIWGGEFGRTNYSQGKLTRDNYGRDHHPRCFTVWMAGAGIKKGLSYGQTDELCYNVIQDPVHVHDFQATMLHLLGVDHEQLTFKHQGRRYRLTDVHGKVIKDLLA